MTSGTGLPVLSVCELGELVREGLRTLFDSPIWVEGQVSNLHQARSGHVYFDLVEPSDEPGRAPAAVCNVALWKGVRIGVQRTLSEAGVGNVTLVGGLLHCGAYVAAAVTGYDHRPFYARILQRLQDVQHHRSAAYGLQHLRLRRAHARSDAGRKNDGRRHRSC